MAGTYKSFKIEDAAGVVAYTVVVQGAADGGCKKPAAANAAAFLGITQDDQSVQGAAVAVKTDGPTLVRAKGVVAAGNWVNVGDTAGRVADCQTVVDSAPGTNSVTNVVGKALSSSAADDDLITIELRDFAVKTATS